jgi:hypothetical protein
MSDSNMNPKLPQVLHTHELDLVSGGRFKRVLVQPDYVEPQVLYDDGINIHTTDPTTSNVAYDSPWTPIA